MHEVRNYLLHQKRMELKQLNRKVANLAPLPPVSSPAPKSCGGFIKRVAKAAKSELVGTEQSNWEASQRGMASMIKYDIKTHDEDRQSWGAAVAVVDCGQRIG
jgi:hypothetical protein